MTVTNFPNGIASFGMPIIGGVNIPSLTGNLLFVSSVIGSDGNDGKSTLTPKATLSGAISAATASNGDVIVLMPGHAETITGAAGVSVSKAGLTIVGLGFGTLRPKFTYTTAVAASFDISAANTTIVNCVFSCSIDAQTAMINVTAADVSFYDCDIINCPTAATAAILGILTAATATRLIVERCRFLGLAIQTNQATTAQIQHESGVDYIIRNCYFTGKLTQAILNVATVLRGLIDGNRFVIGTGTVAVTMAAASTPFIVNNRFNMPSGTTPIVAAAGFVAGNIYSAAAGVTAGTAATI